MSNTNKTENKAMQEIKEGKLPEKFLDAIELFQTEYPIAMLTGTCALMLYGFNLGREPTDIDFILPRIGEIPDDWKPVKLPDDFEAKCYSTEVIGIRVEIIIWDEHIGLVVDGINLASIYSILDAKHDLGQTGTKKHLTDLWVMLKQTLPKCLHLFTQPAPDGWREEFEIYIRANEDSCRLYYEVASDWYERKLDWYQNALEYRNSGMAMQDERISELQSQLTQLREENERLQTELNNLKK